ncbi:RNA-dependent ATPase rok1 [Irineochytrium annulatum]|nr:RNA-dependent ATPase rok1 [Irineochytrium annulatum]
MDIFKILSGGGAKFDKKRFKSDFEAFDVRKTGGAPALTEEILPPHLDFFGSASAGKAGKEDQRSQEKAVERAQNQLKRKKPAPLKPDRARKRQKGASDDLGSEDEEQESGDDHACGANDDEEMESRESENDDDGVEARARGGAEFSSEEEVAAFRKAKRIGVQGTDVPHPSTTFSALFDRFRFPEYIRENIEGRGYPSPTPVQMQTIPIALHDREVMAIAPTGSGKTMAFTLPILYDLKDPAKGQPARALIISPTRELAVQIYREISDLLKGKGFKICVLSKSHLAGPASGVVNYDIIITTPLRLVHSLSSISLTNVRHLILDEADKLLELGFLEQMDDIFAACTNEGLKKSLFSATMPSSIETLARTFMKDPIRVIIGQANSATDTITQKLTFVGEESGKLIEVRQMIRNGLKPPVLVFVQSIDRAKELFHELIYDGIHVDVMHSERSKPQRDKTMDAFRSGKTWVLIATDLMARGIDFKGVALVINYDFPQSVQSYIHRIGRTGRAGRPGSAVTFFTKSDAPYLKIVVNVMRQSGCEVPEWMLNVANPSKNLRKQLKNKAIDRDRIDTTPKDERKRTGKKKSTLAVRQETIERKPEEKGPMDVGPSEGKKEQKKTVQKKKSMVAASQRRILSKVHKTLKVI